MFNVFAHYKPISHGTNRMNLEGDVVSARKYYYSSHSKNLMFLLRKRFDWMNEYISKKDKGVEVGSGIGVSKDIIISEDFILTDFSENPWLTIKNVDALSTPFEDSSFNFVVSSNMIHHVPHPVIFLKEMSRILKPGGLLLIQEINASLITRIILRLMRHEGYSLHANVFDEKEVVTDPNDLWSANCAIPNLLFDDKKKFEKEIQFFKIKRSTFSECLLFLNSGGVIAKTIHIPLPYSILNVLYFVDTILSYVAPSIFSMQRQIVLKNNK